MSTILIVIVINTDSTEHTFQKIKNCLESLFKMCVFRQLEF